MDRLRRARFTWSGLFYGVLSFLLLWFSIGLAYDLAKDSWHEIGAKSESSEAAGQLVTRHGDLATVAFDANGKQYKVQMFVPVDAQTGDNIPVTYSGKNPHHAYAVDGGGARIFALIIVVLFLVAAYLLGDRGLRALDIVGPSTPRPLG